MDYFKATRVDGHSDPEVKNRLQHVAQSGFKRLSYTKAIDILLKAIQDFKPQKKGDKLFEFPVGSPHQIASHVNIPTFMAGPFGNYNMLLNHICLASSIGR